MAAATERPVASAVRPGLRHNGQSASPHTPTRTYSSNFSSPGAGFRQEEEVVIFELGSRYLRAGFEGDASPQCSVSFGPETSRRVGDYSDWEPQAGVAAPEDISFDGWAESHELWRYDLHNFDLGLFQDRLERAVRNVYNQHLLTVTGLQRLILVLPPLVPHPLLSALLNLLFTRWNFPSIGLLPSPTLTTIAAGLRSALVVDIGWHETVVTAVYEYRETRNLRSIRAMKLVVQEMARVLSLSVGQPELTEPSSSQVNFDFAEETVMRLGWCRPGVDIDSSTTKAQFVEVDIPSGSRTLHSKLSQFNLSEPIELGLLASNISRQDLDDEELPLSLLVFKALVDLPPDVRGICMSRVVFSGGGSQIHGLPNRVLSDVYALASKSGWNDVRGKVVEQEKAKSPEQNITKPIQNSYSSSTAAQRNTEVDPIEEKLRRIYMKDNSPPTQGVLREVKSLGAWAGASLLSALKVRGLVEVDRERFLQQGLSGAHKEGDISLVPQRQSFGPGLAKAAGDRSSWTLAGWG